MKKMWNTFISLRLSWKKKTYWRNYQTSLMVYTYISTSDACQGKLEVYESKWMPCLAWSVVWFVLCILVQLKCISW